LKINVLTGCGLNRGLVIMGSPGTYSLSEKKSRTIKRLLSDRSVSKAIGEGASGAPAKQKGAGGLSPLAAKFFNEVVLEDWAEFIKGKEWRSCASLLLRLASEATAKSQQKELTAWAEEQEITGETPLVDWGNRLVMQLDRQLGDRDLMAFDLATYALRQTLEELYSPDQSPFDLDKRKLLKKLGTVNTQNVLQTYIASYFRQIIRYTMSGYRPENAKEDKKRAELVNIVGEKEIPKLAREFWSRLQKHSEEKSGAGRAASLVLEDVPEWLTRIATDIFAGEHKK
jgi:hypothetical protein